MRVEYGGIEDDVAVVGHDEVSFAFGDVFESVEGNSPCGHLLYARYKYGDELPLEVLDGLDATEFLLGFGNRNVREEIFDCLPEPRLRKQPFDGRRHFAVVVWPYVLKFGYVGIHIFVRHCELFAAKLNNLCDMATIFSIKMFKKLSNLVY